MLRFREPGQRIERDFERDAARDASRILVVRFDQFPRLAVRRDVVEHAQHQRAAADHDATRGNVGDLDRTVLAPVPVSNEALPSLRMRCSRLRSSSMPHSLWMSVRRTLRNSSGV